MRHREGLMAYANGPHPIRNICHMTRFPHPWASPGGGQGGPWPPPSGLNGAPPPLFTTCAPPLAELVESGQHPPSLVESAEIADTSLTELAES